MTNQKLNTQTPRDKIQTTTNNQSPNCLGIEIWNLFGYCVLYLGYYLYHFCILTCIFDI